MRVLRRLISSILTLWFPHALQKDGNAIYFCEHKECEVSRSVLVEFSEENLQ